MVFDRQPSVCLSCLSEGLNFVRFAYGALEREREEVKQAVGNQRQGRVTFESASRRLQLFYNQKTRYLPILQKYPFHKSCEISDL